MNPLSWGVGEWTLVVAVVSAVGALIAVLQNIRSARRETEVHDVAWEAVIMSGSTLSLKNVGGSSAREVRVSCSAGPQYHEEAVLDTDVEAGKEVRQDLPKLKKFRERLERSVEERGEYHLSLIPHLASHEARIVVSWKTRRGAPKQEIITRPHFKFLRR